MFSLIGTLKKSGSVGRWETKRFIGMALDVFKISLECSKNACPKFLSNKPKLMQKEVKFSIFSGSGTRQNWARDAG